MSSVPDPLSENSALRSKIRVYDREQRQECRIQAKDALRLGLGQIKKEVTTLEDLGIKDVIGLASRIKRRKHATSEDLYRLALAFLQGNENINAFAAIPGAIQVVVKELSGPHIQRQIDAVECLCNLSLGEAHVSEKIASLAGSYMVTYLDGKEERLKHSCLWTLANVLVTCDKAAQTLLQMQLVPKLWKLYTAPASELRGCQEDAGTCLFLVATHALQHVSTEDRKYLGQHLHEKRPEDPASEYFMYIVHQLALVGPDQGLGVQQAGSLVNFFGASLSGEVGLFPHKLRLFYGVRVLANLAAIGDPALLGILANPEHLVRVLNQLFALHEAKLSTDLMRLLRNFLELNICDSNLVLDRLNVYA
ncbi:uncharacterized protein LOC110187296 [Drosophila serrata]|uniref:uncharacterized protein LOC110187296 n=1 Tax=Drosophila serrata TaxID=7274 RepID=UPI000A1CFDBF|nr:uncharacterized protein LOC110187296 [Drosophila serrata]